VTSLGGQSPDLKTEVAALEWYHTMELAPGVVTPGWQDTRPILAKVPFPESLEGKRCLDVGTFDGFWAFEMERRSASEVVAIDILDPERWDWSVGSTDEVREAIGRRKRAGQGFETAAGCFGSQVKRLDRSVYDLDESMGKFDLVYLGSLLVHLRDPIRALERLRSVCSCQMIVVDGIDLLTSVLMPHAPVARFDGKGRPWWWTASQAGLSRMVEAGGFEITSPAQRIFIPPGPGQPLSRRRPRMLRTHEGRYALTLATWGDPHAMLVARPR